MPCFQVINGAKNVLKSSLETIPMEVKKNSLTMLAALARAETDEFRQMLDDLNFDEEVYSGENQELKDLPEAEKLREVLKK